VIAAAGIEDFVGIFGRPSALVFGTKDADGKPSQPYRTLMLQELMRHGVLGQSLLISAAHTDDDIAVTVAAFEAAAEIYAKAIAAGTTDGYLEGRPVAPAIREFAAPRRLEA